MGSKRLMIDGDISRYELGAVCQSVEVHFGNKLIKPHSDRKVREVVNAFIEKIVEATDCDGLRCSSRGRTNYRTDIAKTHIYKGQRSSPKPHHWATVGQILVEEYNAYTVHGAEADDCTQHLRKTRP